MYQPMLAVTTAASATMLCLAVDARQASALQYDRGRPDGGGLYYPDDHYRDGNFYPQRRIGHRDRIYRGRDGRYYCRRIDGTTGIIVGEDVDRLLGEAAAPGESRLIGEVPGAAPFNALSLRIDSGAIRCR